jgi:hexulose-6-phosphate isomerase
MALIKAVNYWSFPGGLEGTLSPFDAIRLSREHNFPALELGIGDAGSAFGIDATQSLCEDLVAEAAKHEVQLLSTASGLYWGRSLGDGDASARVQARKDLEAMIQIASWLGAKTHLTIPGAVEVFFLPERPVLSYNHVWKHATEGLQAVLPLAKEKGVRLGIENVWNKFLLSPLEMNFFLNQFESDFIGAYVDVANILPYGYPEQWIRALGDKVFGVHFKDFRKAVGTAEGFVDLLEGDVNFAEVIKALDEIGYDGPVPCEMIPHYKTNGIVRVANASRAMDAILS